MAPFSKLPRERVGGLESVFTLITNDLVLLIEFADIVMDLKVDLEHANNTESPVRVRWTPPVDPNGEIVTYEVAYKLQKPDQVEEKKCIPAADFNQTAGYLIKLNEGLYSFRVRANSIAGYGDFTEVEHIKVEVG